MSNFQNVDNICDFYISIKDGIACSTSKMLTKGVTLIFNLVKLTSNLGIASWKYSGPRTGLASSI